MDNMGQVALEYLLIFFVSVIILSAISLPLISESMDNSRDISKSVEAKDTLLSISNSINYVYYAGYGSKRTVGVHIPLNMQLSYRYKNNNHFIYTSIKLSDNSTKLIEIQTPCKISFSNRADYYYVSLKERWYYNTEIKWITSSSGEKSINIYFK